MGKGEPNIGTIKPFQNGKVIFKMKS